jgi:Zn-dependent protease with chaperone function
MTLDDAELAAGLEHEWGHINRGHRLLSVLGHGLFALARLVPGTGLALRQLTLQLERDADEYAVRRTGDPLALASAICKSARLAPRQWAVGAQLSGSMGAFRLEPLINPRPRPGGLAQAVALTVATCLLALCLILLVGVPEVAAQSLAGMAPATPASC